MNNEKKIRVYCVRFVETFQIIQILT